ncbi:MAG: hypothetical protein O7B27_02130 [Gammaproteobacteria bacterium]|nr:hypothetical protein [Gammaproteobacteria bacterium]
MRFVEVGRQVGAQVASIVAGAVDEGRLAAPEELYEKHHRRSVWTSPMVV